MVLRWTGEYIPNFEQTCAYLTGSHVISGAIQFLVSSTQFFLAYPVFYFLHFVANLRLPPNSVCPSLLQISLSLFFPSLTIHSVHSPY